MISSKQFQLYWEDISERVLYVGLDDMAWQLPEKLFHYKKKKSLYIFHHNKLAAYYLKRDSEREAEIGFKFYKRKANINRIVRLKKCVKQEVVRHIQNINSVKLNALSDNKLKKYVIHSLELFLRALSTHYLTQPQFFEKFEKGYVSLSLKTIQTISNARLQYTRSAWTDALKSCKKVLKIYGQRLGMSLECMESFTQDEIVRGNFRRGIARRRIKTFVLYADNHYHKIYIGKTVRRFIREFEKNKKVDFVKGIVGNPGFARGKAFILKNENLDLKKLPRGMKRGMVLIIQNAWPEFARYYKSASAIVTNEGGITSHGVVVARELKIPCVVGTKFATKIFRDGDRVIVDAKRGIIRKMKRN
ncbi:hypothetical protein KKF61_00620 [Patescibacteria group bacterium]|nr:hypothetical protein [Patescibacteria group bacterium]MBU0963609.1 hypothetical protein [Patescibacteria group bacterium]